MTTATESTTISLNDAILRIRKSLRARSGKAWSVKRGEGTAYGWITISAPPARCNEWGYISDSDRAELATLLGLETVHMQGESVPAGSDYRREYVDRAEGRTPTVKGRQYWD